MPSIIQQSFLVVLLLMVGIGIVIRIGALIVMYFISNPTILPLKSVNNASTLNMYIFDQKQFAKQNILTNGNQKTTDKLNDPANG